MGLFSFLKNIGTKIFTGTDAKKPTPPKAPDLGNTADEMLRKQREGLLKARVDALMLSVQNLSVELDGDKVTVYGIAKSQSEKEKIVLALGNCEGIASVDDRMSVSAPPEPEADFYTVEKGDSLSKIAKKYYGNAMKYPVIFEANKPMLSDPDKIYPGQVLRIPKV